MTLKELRKKYVGKVIDEEDLDDDFNIVTDKDGRHMNFRNGDEFVFEARISLDANNKITGISRMTCRRLAGDDATHVNYEPCRVNADDYDILDDCLRFNIITDEEDE